MARVLTGKGMAIVTLAVVGAALGIALGMDPSDAVVLKRALIVVRG